MSGWGDTSGLNKILPYWGFAKFDIAAILNARGYETHAASVSPLGSAWDRTCELYAQLTGTRVDYGKAHSEKFGHERYGRVYEKPLVDGWGEKDENGRVRKINLISHSFGGVSLRMLAVLLQDGCAEEREATTDGSLSPLFEGGHGGQIFSITTLCAPHDGTDMQFALPIWFSKLLQTLYYEVSHVSANVPGLRKVYDVQLEHFGVGEKGSFFGVKEFRSFKDSGDNVFDDVGVDGSHRLNRSLRPLDDIYYFSYAVCGTKANRKGAQLPRLGVMMPGLMPMAYYMGAHTEVTAEGYVVDESWEPNDGVVNTRSSKAPAEEPSVEFDPAHIEKGVWNVMPVIEGNHGSVIGWFRDQKSTMPLYCGHIRRIEALTKEEQYAAVE
jgi:triacylglycerol lipase